MQKQDGGGLRHVALAFFVPTLRVLKRHFQGCKRYPTSLRGPCLFPGCPVVSGLCNMGALHNLRSIPPLSMTNDVH